MEGTCYGRKKELVWNVLIVEHHIRDHWLNILASQFHSYGLKAVCNPQRIFPYETSTKHFFKPFEIEVSSTAIWHFYLQLHAKLKAYNGGLWTTKWYLTEKRTVYFWLRRNKSQKNNLLYCDLCKQWFLNLIADQWRCEAKCRPGPTIKVPPFQPIKFTYKNLKWK